MPDIIIVQDDQMVDIEEPMVFTPEHQRQAEKWLSREHPLRTICNVIRKIDRVAHNPEVTQLCLEAIWMAKKMNKRLEVYHQNWSSGLWLQDREPL